MTGFLNTNGWTKVSSKDMISKNAKTWRSWWCGYQDSRRCEKGNAESTQYSLKGI